VAKDEDWKDARNSCRLQKLTLTKDRRQDRQGGRMRGLDRHREREREGEATRVGVTETGAGAGCAKEMQSDTDTAYY